MRLRRMGELTLVLALTFVKVFPFSSQLLGAAGALVLGSLAEDSRVRRWFSPGPGGWRSAIAWGMGAALVVFGADAVLYGLYPLLGIASVKLDRFASVRGNLVELAQWLALIWMVVAVTEELISRAFMIDQWLDVLPAWRAKALLGVVFSALTFSAVHFYEGWAGLISNFVAGVLFGALYLLRGRTLGGNVLAHGLADSFALVAIYFGVA